MLPRRSRNYSAANFSKLLRKIEEKRKVFGMKSKFKEWFSIRLAKYPGRMVLCAILLFNVAFFLLSAVVISHFSLQGTEKMSFLEAAFCTVTMILDAGCVQFVVSDIGGASVAVAVICLSIIIIGMITFTGAVIGYITNFISNFIDDTNDGNKKLTVSGHIVILNWNTRASEIINDLLYCSTRQKVIVLVGSRKEEIKKEIDERLSDTIAKENAEIIAASEDMPLLKRRIFRLRNHFKKNITVVVREGDVFSSKQLRDISLEHAKTVIILGNDINNTVCKYEYRERIDDQSKGNSQTIKTLMQVADITAAEYSDDDQKIIVEITDEWTSQIVDKIIQCKQVNAKCNIVPIRVSRILGQILSQFSLMPELNLVYKELFSNKGAAFYSIRKGEENEIEYTRDYLKTHKHATPLTFMDSNDRCHWYYAAGEEKDIYKTSSPKDLHYSVELSKNYWIERKSIIILGHNSKCEDIMRGFDAFTQEWGYKNKDEDILKIVVIDDEKSLEKFDRYKAYPFVVDTVAADIYDRELICSTIGKIVDSNCEDTSILILSDDSALSEDIDANVLTNLVYVQDIINQNIAKDKNFKKESIDVIVEIIDPKHYDIVNSYSVNNVVISNRYISKMITQIGEKEALFDFYADILTYDENVDDGYKSKEIYTKKVVGTQHVLGSGSSAETLTDGLFKEMPKKCKADELVRAVYEASVDKSMPVINPTLTLGYVKKDGKMVLFSGDRSEITVELESTDKLVVFSNH